MSKKIKVKSETTPNHNMQLRSYIAELMMVRQYGLDNLGPYFWRSKRWRGTYTREVRAITKFINKYGEEAIVNLCCNMSINTFANYADIEFFLQREASSIARKKLPKDISGITCEVSVSEDLREPRSFIKQKGLFDKLDEIEQNI